MVDRYEVYENALDMATCELDKLVKTGDVTPNILNTIGALTDIIKDLEKSVYYSSMYEDDYESQRSGRYYGRGSSYRMNYRNSPSYDDTHTSRGYSSRMSRGSSKDSMLDHLYSSMDYASNDEEKQRIKRMIDEIEKG